MTYRNCKEMFLQIRSEGMEGHWIVDFFRSMSSTLPMLKNGLAGFFAEHHLLFRKVFSNTKFVRTNFDSFNVFCIRISEFFLHSEMSIIFRFRSG